MHVLFCWLPSRTYKNSVLVISHLPLLGKEEFRRPLSQFEVQIQVRSSQSELPNPGIWRVWGSKSVPVTVVAAELINSLQTLNWSPSYFHIKIMIQTSSLKFTQNCENIILQILTL